MTNKLSLMPYQVGASEQARDLIISQIGKPRPHGGIWVCPARTGKTYSMGWAIAEALKVIPEDHTKFCEVLWLTRKGLKIQSSRVLQQAGVSHRVLVESSQAMTNSFGESFIHWQSVIVQGQIDHIPVWDKDMSPNIIILDECQDAKNPNTLLAKLLLAAIKQGIMVLLASATPYTRLSETKVTLCALGLCNETTWKATAQHFAEGISLDDYSTAAMRRLDDYLIARGLKFMFKDIKYKHRVFNKVRIVDFESPKHKEFYDEAYARYLEEIRKHNRKEPQGVRAIWVAMQKFRQSAEMIRAGLLARVGNTIKSEQRKQIAIITNFVDTQDIIRDCLVQKYHIPEDKISIIRGGQSDRHRQREVDKFQNGYSEFALAIGKSGGAGLSLHHDRPQGRPRHLLLPPTWSAIELVQFLGRCHGPSSLSTTYQDTVWYKDTIEEKVAAKVEIKLRSLKEIVDKRETWVDLFSQLSEDESKEIEKEMLKADLEELKDEDGNIFVDSMAIEALQ